MKRCINLSLVYAIAGMAAGVFFREFTKINDFSGATSLSRVHTHLFMLGMFVYLIAALFSTRFNLQEQRIFRNFNIIYNIGVPITTIMMLIRGIFQVTGTVLPNGADAAISGISGLGHILTAAGLIHFIIAVKKCAKASEKA